MGACDFENIVTVEDLAKQGISRKQVSAKKAFDVAVEESLYMNGHGGYSGTISEKDSFAHAGTAVGLPAARALEEQFMAADDPRYCSKWGKAGCITFYGTKPVGRARTITLTVEDNGYRDGENVPYRAKEEAERQGLVLVEVVEKKAVGKGRYDYLTKYEVTAKVKSTESSGEIEGYLFFGFASS